MTTGYLITCEHASNKIPKEYAGLFYPHKKLLETHRGWDIGSLECYLALCKAIPCCHQQAKWSRLLIELNRSLPHPNLSSSITKNLDKPAQQRIIQQYYLPYHENVIKQIEHLLRYHQRILHISVHSFTPVLNNVERNADIGLLYDPKRQNERDFCYQFKHSIKANQTALNVRMNYPYLGTSDGLTTLLRKQYSKRTYLGIELEMNQKHFICDQRSKNNFIKLITFALKQTINEA